MPALIHLAGLVNMTVTFRLFPVLKAIAITKANFTSLNKSKLTEFEKFECSCRNNLLKDPEFLPSCDSSFYRIIPILVFQEAWWISHLYNRVTKWWEIYFFLYLSKNKITFNCCWHKLTAVLQQWILHVWFISFKIAGSFFPPNILFHLF